MATPMTADQFVAQLKKWGLRYVEHDGPGWTQVGPGWRTHNRAGHGDWGPVHGVMQHHTGDDLVDATDLAVLWNGRSDLPGPLVQAGNDDQGVIHLVGCGRANHAGGGDPAVLDAVMNESYTTRPPTPHCHEGSPGSIDGNIYFYGLENMFSGSHAMTAPQYRSAVLYSAAICDFHGWSAKSVIGHKEWSDWKPDPASTDMTTFRADVATALRIGAPKLAPPPELEEFTMYQRYDAHDGRGQFVITVNGAVHIKNPTHLAYLLKENRVSADIKTVTVADLNQLLAP